ncbi:S8 family serine peptidase [Cereibacter azotoformans]|uniref:Subtilase family protein n=1 Tax=Cereibacter azotoformans TaxID=43057 RepID=A0A2T5K8N7_9RHOB|nr:S8 family serine peptidase [Cereibacter azotoformans]AXQ94885.1 peptidase S8 [Cereibacter sphaeroides]MBO4170245.1 S8 family serine peptidase [Cereibacter azotoformans]PTR18702.1 subtilase family protein [Cereibacter azotoformans]UIJ30461.1 S8 family serine peptidase [Cereibacter azotoformans]
MERQTMTRPVAPRYYWLWHLAALKVIDADFGPLMDPLPPVSESALREVPAPGIRSTVWDRIKGGTATVALIDTGVSRTHPNLASRVDADRSIDFTTHRYGAQSLAMEQATPWTREGRRAFFPDLDLDGLHPLQLSSHEQDFLEALVEDLRQSRGVTRPLPDGDESFSAHGTACAGLIVGEPAAVAPGSAEPLPPERAFPQGEPNPNGNLLPYFGVDPFSHLISIRTSFESDPYQYINAFLYAWQHKVDVIVLPRGLPDPVRGPLRPKEDLKADLETWKSRHAADLFARLEVLGNGVGDPFAAQPGFQPDRPWKILSHLMQAISCHIPVICAAGNDGESQLIYPAGLADDSNGIVAVGAVTAEGLRAGYSSYGEGLTLVAPADDYPVYNRHQMRLNRFDPLIAMHDYSVAAGKEHVFCPLELVTTDLPGVFGYDSGSRPWSSVMPTQGNPGLGGGYYTAFGGTSGACSLIGGLVALAQRARRAAGKAPLDGLQIKRLLVRCSSTASVVEPGCRPLTPDTMNADDEHHLGHAAFFGAGLPDAGALVTAALAGT